MKSENKSKTKFWNLQRIILLVFIVVLIIGSIYLLASHWDIFSSRQGLIDFINSFGVWSPIMTILIVIIEVILAPIPGGFIPIVTGFLFGPILGSIYTWIGNVIGSLVAFWLAHHFGKPLVKHLVKKDKLDYYHDFIFKKQYLIWLLYIIPLFPIDIISFALGLTKIKTKKFVLIMAIGFIPNVVILNYLGYMLVDFDITNFRNIILLVFIVLLVVLVLWGVRSYIKNNKVDKTSNRR